MTYELGDAIGGAGWLARARKAFAEHRRYLQTVAELEALTDRELSDLGIARFAIRDIARDSVYG
jgi:uncharacterized protein YjiS (DUF1127 family)